MVRNTSEQLNTTQKAYDVPFAKFFYAVLIGHLIFAIPTLVAILLLHILEVKPLVFIIMPIAIVSIPIGAAVAWLIAKGSNWANTRSVITALCGVPGRFYAVLFGGLLGFRLFQFVVAIVFIVLFYIGAVLITIPLGRFLTKRLLHDNSHNQNI